MARVERTHSDWIRWITPAAGLCVCAAIDPHAPPGIILCPFRILTGLPCPFCGMTRSVASLLRLRWTEAIEYHVFGPVVFACLVAWWLFESGRMLRWWRGDALFDLAIRPQLWIGFLGINIVYTAMRWWGILKSSRL